MNGMEEENRNLRTDVPTDKTEKYGEKRSFWHINREMLPYKLHFFLFLGGSAAVFPFQAAFGITALGLTAGNIAACYTACQVSDLLLKPAIGYLADYFNRLKSIIVGLAVIKAIFCLLMIIIPSTNMPGVQTMKFTITSRDNTYCQLCLNSETLELVSPKRLLDKEKIIHVASCFNNSATENILMNCSSQYRHSINSRKDHFEVKQTTCNLSNIDSLFSKKHAALEDANVSRDSLELLYISTSKISSICLFPTDVLIFHTNMSSQDLNQYCYSLLNESASELQHLPTKSYFTPTYCNNLYSKTLKEKDEQSISTANLKTYQFWVYAICLVIIVTCVSSEFTMSDTVCYENVQGADYGQQRVWGAISWGIIAPLAGYLIDYTKSYMASWLLYAGIVVLQIWNLSRMDLVKPDFSLNVIKDMKKIFSSMEFVCFAAGVFMNGFFTGIIWFHLPWFIISIGGNELVIGLLHTISCFGGNTPAMYFSGWLIKKLGHFNLVSLALICYGVRFFLYSYLHNPWWMLPIECLHGFSYGSFYAAMTSYAKSHAKPGTEATTQSLLAVIFDALGAGVGCIVIGISLEYYGGHTTFFYASILCAISTIINILSTLIISYRKSSQDASKSAASIELN